MTDVIEYVRRSTLNMTNLNTACKESESTPSRARVSRAPRTAVENQNAAHEAGSRLYHIVENDFCTTVTTKWKVGLRHLPMLKSCWRVHSKK